MQIKNVLTYSKCPAYFLRADKCLIPVSEYGLVLWGYSRKSCQRWESWRRPAVVCTVRVEWLKEVADTTVHTVVLGGDDDSQM